MYWYVYIVWFSLICSRGGGSAAAVVTLDTVADESRKKMADSVTRFPAGLCSRDEKLRYYRRLDIRFSCFFCALLPTFLVFSFLIPVCFFSSCSFVCAARICCSQQVLKCSTSKYVFLCHFICILPHLGIPLFLYVCLVFFS